jgi:hypothetical protein
MFDAIYLLKEDNLAAKKAPILGMTFALRTLPGGT